MYINTFAIVIPYITNKIEGRQNCVRQVTPQ